MRRPDRDYEVENRGETVSVKVWADPTDIPWDGSEPLPDSAEGWDVLVKVSLTKRGHAFTGTDSLGSIWILPDREGNAYLEDTIKEIQDQAIANLWTEVSETARGDDITRAQIRQKVAKSLPHSK